MHRCCRISLVASLVWCWASPVWSRKPVTFPKVLEKNLVLRLESDSGVQTDAASKDVEPAVLSWTDLAGQSRVAKANETADANAQQRKKNGIEDGTRPTEETFNLPRAKRRQEAKHHDSAPALVTCPKLNVPAIHFDGDDYLFIETAAKKDPLTPGKGGFSVVVMMSIAAPEGGQSHFFNHWLGVGHPGIMSDSQWTLNSHAAEEEEVFGKAGKKKESKNKGAPKSAVSVRVVPIMVNRDTPSVREHAEIEGELETDQPTLISFNLDGKNVLGRIDGDDKPFKVGASGFSEGSWHYVGEVNPHADVPGVPMYIGAGPSAKHMIDFTGEGAHGLLYGVLVFKKKLGPTEFKLAETYLACHFGLDDKCDKELAKEAGMFHEEL